MQHKRNSKKVNWLFLSIILVEFGIVGLIIVLNGYFRVGFTLSIAENLILSEMILFLPALVFVLASLKGRGAQGLNEMLGFHKIKISSFFMVILFTLLIMPMTTAINAISMIFVDNAVTAISGDVLRMPFSPASCYHKSAIRHKPGLPASKAAAWASG